jgi:hypothetical protein
LAVGLVAAALAASLNLPAAQGAPGAVLPEGAVILPEVQATALLEQCSRGAPKADGKAWRPTTAEILSLEARLPDAMRRVGATEGKLTHTPAGWRRQYAGITVGGRRFVYGNFFPAREFSRDWKTTPVMVCDGGANFFGVTYDVAARRIVDIQFNGVA